jgi:hypothetical protein
LSDFASFVVFYRGVGRARKLEPTPHHGCNGKAYAEARRNSAVNTLESSGCRRDEIFRHSDELPPGLKFSPYLIGRAPAIRISTNLRALRCQSGLVATLATDKSAKEVDRVKVLAYVATLGRALPPGWGRRTS